MRILITNDDSISSAVLPDFVRWAKKLGEVTVAVPKVEQSGKSQAIDFHRSVEIKRVEDIKGCETYVVDSTPADCVRFAVTGLHREYDIVFSGINRGYNLGADIAYSGTVGAILEAKRLNTKAIAFSTDVDNFEGALSNLDAVYSYITENGMFDYADLFNVNFPWNEPKDISLTKQGGMFYSDEFVDCGNDMYIQVGAPVEYDSKDISVDIFAIMNGYISVTPLTDVKTDLSAYERIKTLNI